MQLSLTRGEIIRMMRAYVGAQTNSALASAVNEQHIALVNAAAMRVQQESRWVPSLGRVTVDLGAEQNMVVYPAGCTVGGVMNMAVYDGGDYRMLEPAHIPVAADRDQEQAAGGATFQAVQGIPRFYQQGPSILFDRYSDQAYKLRIEFTRSAVMASDEITSFFDGQLIAYAATAALSVMRGTLDMEKYYENRYAERMRSLRAWMASGTRFAFDSEADLGEDAGGTADQPNWDRSLVNRPGMAN